VIEFREPPRTALELRWRLFGILFRVYPSFFLLAALISYLFVGPDPIGIAVAVACIFGAILFTELVQGLVYRSYGLRSTVLIREFIGGIYPEAEPPTALQRIAVALSVPASSFLLFALVYYSNQEYHWADANKYAGFAYFILWLVTLFWGVIGLLPVYPYSGGRVILEVLSLISPGAGLLLTLVISIVVGLVYIAYSVAVYLGHLREIQLMEGVRLPASIIVSVFFALAVVQNWQVLQYVLSRRRSARGDTDEYDDRRPWEQ
jgi:stage IV sporulation protein FB